MLKPVFALLFLLTLAIAAAAQDSIPPEIRVEETGDSVHFSARLRPLRQIAGAPAAFYTYFWELGDGRFSFDQAPLYAYRDTGTYQVRLYATNNYDDGKAPPTRPHPVKIKKKTGSNVWASHFFHGSGNIEMKINRNPRPGEDFVAIVGYRSQQQDTLAGTIVLFYNERQFGQKGFDLAEKRYYNREDSSNLNTLMAHLEKTSDSYLADRRHPSRLNTAYQPSGPEITYEVNPNFAGETQSMLQALQREYTEHTVLHFPAVRQGEEKFVFMDLNTLPTMIQDTNATVALTAMMVPDDPASPPELYRLEVAVVSSHDPNYMQIKPRRINYRFMGKKKELTYTVHFQNTGRGPAKKISIGIAIPRQLNGSTVQLKTMSPVCRWCDSTAYDKQSCIDTVHTTDSIYFVFNNIYLPGLQQEGINDKDSTKGFVEYAIRFRKKPKKIPFSTSAAIIFDKNEPVLTNRSTARFIKGISPGIMAGYVYSPSNGNYSTNGSLQLGYILAPFSPSRPYFQVEAWAGLLQQDNATTGVIRDQKDTAIGIGKFLIVGRETKTTVKKNSFEVTPLHFRYNFNNWIAIGLGAQVMVNISQQTTTENKVYLATPNLPLITDSIVATIQKTKTQWLHTWNAAPFADLQVGRVRTGPVIGLRYLRLLKGDVSNRFFLYAGFKL
ncbi:MAG: PKD domain-containing protein [Chitinophagaceae bacterium]|nr:PKD domain-containing protein [Chitinophagaceae bacterium]